MLVLSRKNGESIIIGDDIRVTVLESRNNRVKIGITAPKDVDIYREELGNRKDEAKENDS